MLKIEKLKPFLQEAWQVAGYSQPTAIQNEVAESIEQGVDIIAESATGTGKTLAYLIPLLNKIDTSNDQLQVVILAPSRELVMQIVQVAQDWGQPGGVKATSLIGGVPIKRQVERLKKRPQLIAGTPGRVLELVSMKKLKMHHVKTMVLDEGDQLLSGEHLSSVKNIVKSTMKDRQLLLFSATIKAETESLAQELMKQPNIVKVESGLNQDVTHCYFECDKRDRIKLLEKLAKNNDFQGLVFVNDIGNLAVLAEKLAFKDVRLGVIHSDAKKGDRQAVLKAFQQGDLSLLLATDLAARGLDIVGLQAVVHYDVCHDSTTYTHRSGRTGRAGAEGTVISFVAPSELRDLRKIANKLAITLEQVTLYKGKITKTN